MTRYALPLAAALAFVAPRASALDDGAAELLRKAVIRGVAAGKVKRAYITFAGKPARVRVKSADETTLTIIMSGAMIPLSWEKVKPRQLVGMAARAAESAEEWWTLGLLYAELDMGEKSDEALRKAAEIDAAYKKKLSELRAARAAEAPTKPPPRSGTSHASSPKPRRPAGPDGNFIYPPWKGKTPERGLRTDRPRLLITKDRLAFLRASGKGLPNYGRMRTWCGQNPNGGYYAPMHALVYVIERDEKYGRMAIDNIKRNVVRRGVDRNLNSCFPNMGQAALVYDWCHPLLSDGEKESFRKYMVAEYDAMKDSYARYPYHNYHCAAAYAFGLAGYALHGDDPKSGEMIRNAVRERFEKGLLEAFSGGCAGGAWAEGEGYAYTTVPDVIWLAEAIRTCEGINHFEDPRGRSFLYDRLTFMMFATYPGVRDPMKMFFFVRGDGRRGGNVLPAREQLVSLRYAYAGTRLAACAEGFLSHSAYSGSPYRDGLFDDVFWAAPGLPKAPVAGFRRSHHAKGQGVVLMKSDWTDDATFVSFICGDHYSYHQHADSGSFAITRHQAELAVDSGEYQGSGSSSHEKNYHSRTIAHNSIVLAGYGDKQMNARGIGPADDGGQPTPKAERFYETGNIIAYDPQSAYTYVAGDLTRSFSGRVGGWTRHLLFIRPETVVVFDVVRSSPEHYPRWLVHTWNEPEVDGGSFRAQKDEAALHGKVVLPAAHRVKKLKGFRVAGRNYPPGQRGRDTAQWRLEVSPERPGGATAFLVVMQATKSSVKRMLPVEAIEGGGVGCRIGGDIEVRFNSSGAPGGTLTIRGRKVKLATGVHPDGF